MWNLRYGYENQIQTNKMFKKMRIKSTCQKLKGGGVIKKMQFLKFIPA